VLGIRCVAVSEGEVSAELMPREDLENMGGTIHGGVLAAFPDTVMGAALHARATIDPKVNYLSPLARVGRDARHGAGDQRGPADRLR
jgi:acyl-coenzyme A thioesterase PaaI-like protein